MKSCKAEIQFASIEAVNPDLEIHVRVTSAVSVTNVIDNWVRSLVALCRCLE